MGSNANKITAPISSAGVMVALNFNLCKSQIKMGALLSGADEDVEVAM